MTYIGGRFENLIKSFEKSFCTRFGSQELQYNAINCIFMNLGNHTFTELVQHWGLYPSALCSANSIYTCNKEGYVLVVLQIV